MTSYTYPSDAAKRPNNTVLEEIDRLSTPGSYTLTANNVGSSAFGVAAGSYIFAAVASVWTGVSVQLQALGPDGTTWINVGTPLTANGTQGVVVGNNATLRANVTGSPTGLYTSLS